MKHKDTINPKQLFGSEKEKQEFTYPMWFKSKASGNIIEFIGLKTGKAIYLNPLNIDQFSPTIGIVSSNWTPHTDTNNWEQVENPNEHLDRLDDIVGEAIEEVSKEDSHNAHYKAQKIDTITRCKANMSLEQQKAICIFNCDKYLHRSKGQDLEDIQKVRYYLNWLEEIEIELSK